MVLKLYGSGGSTCTRRVGAFMHEEKISFELVQVDVAHSEHKSPAYLEKQPFGQILYLSRAICRYLEDKFDQGHKLIPTDPKKKGIFEQAASIPRLDTAVFDNLIVELGKRLDAYDVILSKQKYAAGDEFTLVDIFHLPYGWLLEVAGSRIMYDEKRPIVRWWKDITNHKCWQAVKDGVAGSNA
ncbi:hypothetical protein C0995_012065 [Termitomyces sp. Mi166|nr:hypothetical protein C0995_012065 [Termitomyces sp. Mi166\